MQVRDAGKLARHEIKRAIAAARSLRIRGDTAAAVEALHPILTDLGNTVASTVGHPLRDYDYWFTFGPALIKAWREAIKAWIDDEFEGEAPGPRALRKVAQGVVTDEGGQAMESPYASYRGVPVRRFLAGIVGQIFGNMADEVQEIHDVVAQTIESSWVDEIVQEGVPKALYTGLTWVPGWDGECLDDALERLTLKSRRYRSGYIEDLLPCEGLKNLLASVGQCPTWIMAHVEAKHTRAEAILFRQALDGSDCAPPTSHVPQVTAADLMQIIQNGGSSMALPVVYAEINVRALFELDPRQPIDMSLDNGNGHCRGLHDPVNGSGYTDLFQGPAVMPPLQLGIAEEGRFGYDIHSTYDWVRHALRCTPRAVGSAEPLRLAA